MVQLITTMSLFYIWPLSLFVINNTLLGSTCAEKLGHSTSVRDLNSVVDVLLTVPTLSMPSAHTTTIQLLNKTLW